MGASGVYLHTHRTLLIALFGVFGINRAESILGARAIFPPIWRNLAILTEISWKLSIAASIALDMNRYIDCNGRSNVTGSHRDVQGFLSLKSGGPCFLGIIRPSLTVARLIKTCDFLWKTHWNDLKDVHDLRLVTDSFRRRCGRAIVRIMLDNMTCTSNHERF